MSARSIALVLAALLLVAGTILVARNWIESQRSQVTASQETEEQVEETLVLVAGADLPAGTFLKEEHLRWQSWPDDRVPGSYLIKSQVKKEDLYGAVVRRGISDGEPFTVSRIIKPGERGFMAAVLKPGYRAMAIKIGAESGIAGLVFPGDRVDIILTHKIANADEATHRASETVLTNVRVLAMDRRVDDQNGEAKLAKTATLEVTPKQVELLAVARELGRMSLSLRSLAKNEEELNRLAESGEPLKEPDPSPGKTYTWDAEASVLMKWPKSDEDIVSVARGNAVEQKRFERKPR